MKHFTEEDILALKKAEQEQPGGGFCGVFASLIVFVLVAAVVAVLSSIGSKQPGTAVPTTSTPISGPTELVLVNTPTLRPTVTTAVVVAPAIEAATAVPSVVPTVAPTWTPAATYTPLPTYTAVPSQTPAATYTPPATWTAVPTFTPYPTPLPFADVQDTASQYSITNANLTRATYLVAALITFGLLALLISARPSDKDLRRIQKLLEMHLMAALRPAPTPALPPPSPVRTIPLAEWQRSRVAPVQRTSADTGVTGVTGVNTGAAPEMITVSVQPVEEVDTAVMQAICDLWNEIAEGGERPSFNRVCFEYFGAKNSDRLAIIRRAVKWGREQGVVAQVGEA